MALRGRGWLAVCLLALLCAADASTTTTTTTTTTAPPRMVFDFEGPQTTWAVQGNASATQACSTGTVLGGIGVLGRGKEVRATFSALPAHRSLDLSMDLVFVGDWDGEVVRVWVDNVLALAKWHRQDFSTSLACSGMPSRVERVSLSLPHTAAAATVRLDSTLDDSVLEEAFALDNIAVAFSPSPVRDPTPAILRVFLPFGLETRLGRTVDFGYLTTPSVLSVGLRLFKVDTATGSFATAVILVADTPNTNTFTWKVENVAPGTYFVGVRSTNPATNFRGSDDFVILPAASSTVCPPGHTNPQTGMQPCSPCPVGTFSSSATQCSACPVGMTTEDDGTVAAVLCNRTRTPLLAAFEQFPRSFIWNNNGAAFIVREEDAKTAEECLQLCLDDAGCRSADVGRAGVFQEGDCFLSHDDRSSIPFQLFTAHTVLDYYEKRRETGDRCITVDEGVTAVLSCPAGERILDVAFASFGAPVVPAGPSPGVCGAAATVDPACHADASYRVLVDACLEQSTCDVSAAASAFGGPPCAGAKRLHVRYACGVALQADLSATFDRRDGCSISGPHVLGVFSAETSLQSCSQLCLENPCCQSFQFGPNLGCALSHETSRRAGQRFSCDPARGLTLYDRRISTQLEFPLAAVSGATLVQAVQAAVRALPGVPAAAAVAVALRSSSTATRVTIDIDGNDALLHRTLEGAVAAGSFAVVYQGTSYTLPFVPLTGPCTPGTIAPNGRDLGDCAPCRPGTFANPGQTACLPCPFAATSPAAAASELACATPRRTTLFAAGELWRGPFRSSAVHGSAILRVLPTSGRAAVEFHSGLPCANCVFFDGTVGLYDLAAPATGPATLTFTTEASYSGAQFTPAGFFGSRTGFTRFAGLYGDGTFSFVRQCPHQFDIQGGLTAGQAFTGYARCDADAQAQPSIRALDVAVEAANQTATAFRVRTEDSAGVVLEYVATAARVEGPCNLVLLEPTAWVTTGRSAAAHAHQLLGEFRSGEFQGLMQPNAKCDCLGVAAPHETDPTRGATCALHGTAAKWCYASDACIDATPSPSPGFAVFACDPTELCGEFEASLSCPEEIFTTTPTTTGSTTGTTTGSTTGSTTPTTTGSTTPSTTPSTTATTTPLVCPASQRLVDGVCADVEAASDGSNSQAGFGLPVLLGVVGGVILLVALVVLALVKTRSRRSKVSAPTAYSSNGAVVEMSSLALATRAGPLFLADEKWNINRDEIRMGNTLGEGAFGKVVKALLSDARFVEAGKLTVTVAVKLLKPGAAEDDKTQFRAEIELMEQLTAHPNVLRPFGHCLKSDPLLLVVPFMSNGSLKDFLRSRRPRRNPEQPLTVKNLVDFSLQIASAFAFLAEEKVVHRDLAARNILVGHDLVCKVSDFGLARDVYIDDYYRKRTRGKLPWKWMAPESLLDRVFTTPSDVWSYGILLWEIFTLGGSPYPAVEATELLGKLQSGYRMGRPPGPCPNPIYTIMLDCWQLGPDARPTFHALVRRVGQIQTLVEASTDYLEPGDLEASAQAGKKLRSESVASDATSDATGELGLGPTRYINNWQDPSRPTSTTYDEVLTTAEDECPYFDSATPGTGMYASGSGAAGGRDDGYHNLEQPESSSPAAIGELYSTAGAGSSVGPDTDTGATIRFDPAYDIAAQTPSSGSQARPRVDTNTSVYDIATNGSSVGARSPPELPKGSDDVEV